MSPWHDAAMRRQSAPWILIPLLGLLAACTPPDEPIVALAVQDGQPVGVLVTCDGDSFSQLSVFENDAGNDQGDHTLISWAVDGTPTSETVEVHLLGQPPEGWKVRESRDLPASEAGVAVKTEPLTELKPGVRYSLSGSSHRSAISVPFTVSDFARITPDKVLAPTDHDTMKIMSRDAFVGAARDSCA
ncbi:hypothetical protein [Micromonospora sp. NPDC005707]|uniref:hypothetical protein n=1 Tax=Micromonospora sp. NPDC005707 TaxID=3157050 RepID=UPI0033C0ED63